MCRKFSQTGLVRLLLLFAMGCSGAGVAQELGYLTTVAMRDGVQLSTRVILPEGAGPWPVYLGRTPYEDNNLQFYSFNTVFTPARGFAIVVQNTRGAGASEGVFNSFLADGWGEQQDGVDTVAWIREQPWCNGRVFSAGGSGRGIAPLLLSGTEAQLDALFVRDTGNNLYRDGIVFQGGALRKHFVETWFQYLGRHYDTLPYRRPTYEDWWLQFAPGPLRASCNFPVHIHTGWYDTFFQGALTNWTEIQQYAGAYARENTFLVIALRGHGTNEGAFRWPDGSQWAPLEQSDLRFVEHYVLGEDNGFEKRPRVAYYLMGDFSDPNAPGNEWRYGDQWPPASYPLSYYLTPDGLAAYRPREQTARLSYSFDPEDPVPTLGGAAYLMPLGSFDQRPLEGREDVLIFDTPVLESPLEIVGPVQVEAYVSSDGVDTDFTAKLTDVYPTGESIILTEGVLRARFRESLSAPQPMTPGHRYKITIDLWPTGLVVNQGHRLRLALSSSNFPRYDVNPNTGAPLAPAYDTQRTARNTVHLGRITPSRLILPVLSADRDGDGGPDVLDAFPDSPYGKTDEDGDGIADEFELGLLELAGFRGGVGVEALAADSDLDDNGLTLAAEWQRLLQPRTAPIHHSADLDGDYRIDLAELTATVQIYRAGGYTCNEASPPVFLPGASASDCTWHAADVAPADGALGFSELLRMIQLYRGQAYAPCSEGSDGYCVVGRGAETKAHGTGSM